VLLSVLLAVPAARAQDKIVFVDFDTAFNDFYKSKLADKQLREQAEEYETERNTMRDQATTLEDTFKKLREEAQNTALSEEVRDAKRNEAEEKLIELREFDAKLRRFDESRRRQLDNQSKRMQRRIVEEIYGILKDYARKKGYTAVFDSSAQSFNGIENVLYLDERADITTALIELLNEGKE